MVNLLGRECVRTSEKEEEKEGGRKGMVKTTTTTQMAKCGGAVGVREGGTRTVL